jgi:hypothetical protein
MVHAEAFRLRMFGYDAPEDRAELPSGSLDLLDYFEPMKSFRYTLEPSIWTTSIFFARDDDDESDILCVPSKQSMHSMGWNSLVL